MKKKNRKIELLRFIFALIVVLHHSRYMVGDDKCLFLGGSFSVEFFFIVSGYLMMDKISRQSAQFDAESIGKETFTFLYGKVSTVYPETVISWLAACVFTVVCQNLSIAEALALILKTIDDVTFLTMVGLDIESVNGVTWYISSMIICMAVLYPVLRKYKELMLYLGLPLISSLLFGYLCQECGSPRGPQIWLGWTYKGNLRALAEISLGAACYPIVQRLSQVQLNRHGKRLFTIIECGLYGIVFLYIFLTKASRKDYLFIALLAAAISITFSEQSFEMPLFMNNACDVLGKISLPLYLSHITFAQNLNSVLPVCFTDFQRTVIYLCCSLCTSIMIFYFAAIVRKNKKRWLEYLQKQYQT